jgi:hypothetical protein
MVDALIDLSSPGAQPMTVTRDGTIRYEDSARGDGIWPA